jgi:hypothetical protein
MTYFYEGEDLEGAERWMRKAAYRTGGTHCPCCGRHVQVYKRKLTRDMARFVVLLLKEYRKIPGTWVDVRLFPVRGGDYAKVAHWGLAILKENESDPEKKNSGLWKPTQLGVRFAVGAEKVPSHVHLYLNEVVGYSHRLIDVREALGSGFRYDELMNS